jgi:hypothetical protein
VPERRLGDDTFGDDSGNGIVLLPSAAANETYGAASLVAIWVRGQPCIATVLVGYECVKLGAPGAARVCRLD